MSTSLVLLAIIGVPLSYIVYLSRSVEVREHLNYIGLNQTEITSGGNLLNADGVMEASGWSKQVSKKFNPEMLSLLNRNLRLKQFDYYFIFHDAFFFGLAVVDIGFVQVVQVTFFDVENQTLLRKDQMIVPLLHNKLNLTDSFYHTDKPYLCAFESKDFSFSLRGLNVGGKQEQRFLNLSLNHQGHALNLNVRIDSLTSDDSIVVYQPINGAGSQFYYNAKAYNWLPRGELTFDGDEYDIMQSTSNAGMDWGRGVLNYKTFWVWGCAMGFLKNGQRFAVNLGGGFQDDKASSATEDSIFLKKTLFKLRDLVYEYDLKDLDAPFVFRSHDVQRNQFNLTFSWEQQEDTQIKKTQKGAESQKKPLPGQFYCEFLAGHHYQKNSDLVLYSMKFNQFLGIFSGAYVQASGEVIEFHDMMGQVEFNKARW